jgi:hypothetical protein
MEGISTPNFQVGDEHDKAEDGTDCGLALRTLCEQIRLQMEKVELSLVSTNTEHERRKQIPALLQSIADTITRFCAAYPEKKEMDVANLEDEVEGELVMSSCKFSTETKEAEEERRVQVQGYATETSSESDQSDDDEFQYRYEEEAFARFRAGWERAHGDNKIDFQDLSE